MPSSPPVVRSSCHEPVEAYYLSLVRPSLQAFGRDDIETMLQAKHDAQIQSERLLRLQSPIQTWRATVEGTHDISRMSIPSCRRRREANQEINLDVEGNVDMTTIDAERASNPRRATASRNHTRRARVSPRYQSLWTTSNSETYRPAIPAANGT